MSPSELTAASKHPHRRLLWLIVGHVAVGLTAALVAWFAGQSPTLWGYTFVGIVLGQTSLLGIWGGVGPSPWWNRLIGVVTGVSYLSLLLGFGVHELKLTTFFVVAMATTVVVVVLLILRFFRVVIRQNSQAVAAAARIQFSIRHLMVLTFVIACLIAFGKFVQPFLPHGEVVFRILLFAVTGGMVGILPVWFILATTRPVLCGVGVVVAGALAGYCIGRFDQFGEDIWMTFTAAEAMTVVISLLVVRLCGYRLVRMRHVADGSVNVIDS